MAPGPLVVPGLLVAFFEQGFNMNTYYIFYIESKEVIAKYDSATVDLNRYIVSEGPEIGHALVTNNVGPYDCIIEQDQSGNWVAV